jgi:mono/diheme cytochrome c family protein
MRYAILLLSTLLVSISAAACSSKPGDRTGGPVPAPAPSAADFNKRAPDPAAPQPSVTQPPLTAEEVFKTRCSTCHGLNGHGDGPASVALNPKPRNYSDPEWQKSVTDDHIKQTIVGGGVSVGKSPLMVPNPDLAGKDDVLNGLVKIVRSFAGK